MSIKKILLQIVIPVILAIGLILGLAIGLPYHYRKIHEGEKANVTIIIRDPESLSNSTPYNSVTFDSNKYVAYFDSQNVEKMVPYNLEYKKIYKTTKAVTLFDALDQWNNQPQYQKNKLFKFEKFKVLGNYLQFFLKPNTETNPEYLPNGKNQYLALSSPTNSDSKKNPVGKGIINSSNHGIDSLYLQTNDIFYITIWSY